MIKTRARGMEAAAVAAIGFLIAGMSTTAAAANTPTVAPTVDPICGPDNDTVTIPDVEGATYADTGWVEGERTITATADEGYVLDGQSEWTFTDGATLCPFEYIEIDVAPTAPTVVPLCGPNNDTVTIPEVDGVNYTASGWVGGERTITASADAGYGLVVGADAQWTFTDVPVTACPDEAPAFSYTPTKELAYTSAASSTGGLAALAILLMTTGAALVARKARV